MTLSPVPTNPVHAIPDDPHPAPATLSARIEPVGNTLVERACAVVAIFALIAFAAKLALAGQVTDQRREVADRQARIASASVLAQVNNRLIQMLATASVEQGDQSLRDLLSRSGVSFSVKAGPARPPTADAGVQP